MDFSNLLQALERHGFLASAYKTVEEAKCAALRIIGEDSVGTGSSRTINEMRILDHLIKNGNTVYQYANVTDEEKKVAIRKQALQADVFLSSVNAIIQDGSLYNIDATGNRVAGMLFGPKTVVVIAGRNKVVRDQAAALVRTRRDCCPPNTRRLKLDTPCAKMDRCTDCNCPGRICRAFVTLACPTRHVDRFYVLLVDQILGW